MKARCVNRGKMSLHDVFLKANQLEMSRVVVISEKDGNPNGMKVYGDGELFATIKLTVDFSLPKGRMKKNAISLRCEVEELKQFTQEIFEIPLENSDKSDYNQEQESDCNLLWIRTHKRKSTPMMEFFDAQGQPTGPRIYIHDCEFAGEADESS
jgi:U3 small nucleolar ribonucleoprotein protein IMP4